MRQFASDVRKSLQRFANVVVEPSVTASQTPSVRSEMDEFTEAEMIRNATSILANMSAADLRDGWDLGLRRRWVTPDLLKEAGYEFVMDWPADDQPFWMKTRSGPLLSVPYPIEINDSPTMLSRAQPATDFRQMIVDQFETMMEQANDTALVFGIYTFVAGRPFRLRQIAQALDHVTSHPAFRELVWITTPGEIAKYTASLPPE